MRLSMFVVVLIVVGLSLLLGCGGSDRRSPIVTTGGCLSLGVSKQPNQAFIITWSPKEEHHYVLYVFSSQSKIVVDPAVPPVVFSSLGSNGTYRIILKEYSNSSPSTCTCTAEMIVRVP